MNKIRTMIIDDSEVQLKVTSKLVKGHPKLILTSTSFCTKGIGEIIKKERIQLLLLDVEIPEVNGFEFLDTLEYPCLIIMNSTKPSFAMFARKYGVDAFLTKPIDKRHFEKSIDKLLAAPWVSEKRKVFHCKSFVAN